MTGVLGMSSLAVVGLFVFYPPVDELIEDMGVIRVEAYDAVRATDAAELDRRIMQWKRQMEKLPTSVQIRGGSITEEGRENLKEFLYSLETLQQHVRAGRKTEARMMRSYVERLYRKCCDNFRGRLSEVSVAAA
jgi:hypothetical protein